MECSASSIGNIQILSEDNELQKMYKVNTETGKFVCFYLSYLRSIDADLTIYTSTMDFIQTSKHLRLLHNHEFKFAQKYKTYHI